MGIEKAGRGQENQAQQPIEPTGLTPTYILHDELCIVGREELIPVAEGGQQSEQTGQGKDAQYQVVAHAFSFSDATLSSAAGASSSRGPIVTVRLSSSATSMQTFTASIGSSSSTNSGHSMKQSAPL